MIPGRTDQQEVEVPLSFTKKRNLTREICPWFQWIHSTIHTRSIKVLFTKVITSGRFLNWIWWALFPVFFLDKKKTLLSQGLKLWNYQIWPDSSEWQQNLLCFTNVNFQFTTLFKIKANLKLSLIIMSPYKIVEFMFQCKK